jgi:transposase-like protein
MAGNGKIEEKGEFTLKRKPSSTTVLNAGDYRLLQKLLPLFSPDVTRINDLVGFVRRKGTVCYFNYQMPIYHHREDDIASFKVFLCQLVLVGNATPAEIKRVFALAPRELNRWLRQYRKEGPGFFYTNQSGVEIKPKGLLARMVGNIQTRLNETKKRLQSIGHFGLRLKKE